MILNVVKVLCFVYVLQVFILRGLGSLCRQSRYHDFAVFGEKQIRVIGFRCWCARTGGMAKAAGLTISRPALQILAIRRTGDCYKKLLRSYLHK